MNEHIKLINALYKKWSGTSADSVTALPESGSYRQYYLISAGDKKAVGVYNNDRRENEAFVRLNNQLQKTGNNVPEIYVTQLDKYIYIEQYLGKTTLSDQLKTFGKDRKTSDHILAMYFKVVDAMPGLQIYATNGMDYSVCYPRPSFDEQCILWDLNYFKYCLCKPLKISFYEQDLEEDFTGLIKWLRKADYNSFMFRDFQSRNIMLHNNELYFIDFQGGRLGPLQYDLASLLFEANAQLTENIRNEVLDYYMRVYSETFKWFNKETFMNQYYGFVYVRLLQALGAYGFRGYIERKELFIQSLPKAINILAWLVEHHPLPLHLKSLPLIFDQLISKIQHNSDG